MTIVILNSAVYEKKKLRRIVAKQILIFESRFCDRFILQNI